MKALAIFAACLVAASPAFAAPAAAPHPGPAAHPGPAPHPGFAPHHGHGMGGGHGHHGHGGWEGVGNVFFGPFGPEDLSNFPTNIDVIPADADLPPPVLLAPPEAPPQYCPPLTPTHLRHTGPHIIYIGHQPTVNGPRVIYGTD